MPLCAHVFTPVGIWDFERPKMSKITRNLGARHDREALKTCHSASWLFRLKLVLRHKLTGRLWFQGTFAKGERLGGFRVLSSKAEGWVSELGHLRLYELGHWARGAPMLRARQARFPIPASRGNL